MTKSPEPLRHITRVMPPWDPTQMTQCGRRANEFKVVVDRAEAVAFVKEHGQQRSAFVFCMTCLDRLRYAANRTWESDPVAITDEWVSRRHQAGTRDHLERHLNAIAALIANHREEFDGLLAYGLPTLAEHRRTRGQR